MSFLKFWSGNSNSAKKSAGRKEKENNHPQSDDAVFEETETTDAPFKGNRRDGRNLSISRSGRHKYRAKQRSSVISGDLYSESDSNQQQQPQQQPQQQSVKSSTSSTGSAGRASNCREIQTAAHRYPSSGITGQATAV